MFYRYLMTKRIDSKREDQRLGGKDGKSRGELFINCRKHPLFLVISSFHFHPACFLQPNFDATLFFSKHATCQEKEVQHQGKISRYSKTNCDSTQQQFNMHSIYILIEVSGGSHCFCK